MVKEIESHSQMNKVIPLKYYSISKQCHLDAFIAITPLELAATPRCKQCLNINNLVPKILLKATLNKSLVYQNNRKHKKAITVNIKSTFPKINTKG